MIYAQPDAAKPVVGVVAFVDFDNAAPVGTIPLRSDLAPARTDWHAAATIRVAELESLGPQWDGYHAEPPNIAAIQTASSALGILRELGIQPHRIDPSVEGGIIISFRRGGRYGDLECDNDGDVLALTSDGQGNVDAEPIANSPRSIEGALLRIIAYVSD
jgi:hypothetical protein